MLFPKGKGELIDEETLLARIMAAVEGVVKNDVQDTVDLHNFLCGGQVQVHETDGGEPADKDGVAIEGADCEVWTYVFTKGDDDK